ncbi:hypothetical protein ACFVZW_00040 [Streptomyces sp. NPDC059567]|uniref:hypothetical protein n=1 Tax=Streptomyces sp. NPDC059567 TaxID=3346867 RepID=UPI0036A50DA2
MIRQLILSSVATGALLLGAPAAWAADATDTTIVTAADAQREQLAGTNGEGDGDKDDSGWQTPIPTNGEGDGDKDDSGWQTPNPTNGEGDDDNDDSGWQAPPTTGDVRDSGWQ